MEAEEISGIGELLSQFHPKRRHHPATSTLSPQTDKTPSDAPEWIEVTVTVFDNIKHALVNVSLLVYPTADAPTSVMTDASDVAVGAVLQQHINGHRVHGVH